MKNATHNIYKVLPSKNTPSTSWAMRMSVTKPRFFPLIPLSTNAWVRKGKTNCNKLPSNIPKRSKPT